MEKFSLNLFLSVSYLAVYVVFLHRKETDQLHSSFRHNPDYIGLKTQPLVQDRLRSFTFELSISI